MELFADWACSFDEFEKDAKLGENVSLTLKGFPSMTMAEASPAVKPVSVGIWENGAFVEKTTTDEKGKVSLTFDKPGRYVVTATGIANILFEPTDDYTLIRVGHDYEGKTIWGKRDWNDNYYVAYTLTNHDQGPYPYDEIKWLDIYDYADDYGDDVPFDLGYLLYTGRLYYDSPVIAPCCIVNVNSIEKADVSVASATYTGNALTPAVTVKLDGKELAKDKDYSVNYSNNINAGSTATLTITGKGDYFGQISKTFTINKAKQPLEVKVKGKVLKTKDVKKKKKTYKALVVSKNQGAVSYKAKYKNKKSKKALKFSKGKITVKKGTKKGTYVVKVTVTANGNANYLNGSVTKNIKIKVK